MLKKKERKRGDCIERFVQESGARTWWFDLKVQGSGSGPVSGSGGKGAHHHTGDCWKKRTGRSERKMAPLLCVWFNVWPNSGKKWMYSLIKWVTNFLINLKGINTYSGNQSTPTANLLVTNNQTSFSFFSLFNNDNLAFSLPHMPCPDFVFEMTTQTFSFAANLWRNLDVCL